MRERQEEIGKGDGGERGDGMDGVLPWCDAGCIPPCNCLLIIGRRQVRANELEKGGGEGRGETEGGGEASDNVAARGKGRWIRLEAVKRELACEWGVKKD